MIEAVDDSRSCRHPAREFGGDGYRPSEMLAAFFFAAIAMFLAGATTALLVSLEVFGTYGMWASVHLLLLGGVSQLILGSAQFFSTAFLATDPPSSRLVRSQLIVWNAGVLCVVASVPAGATALADLGALLILCGLALFVMALRRLERRSLQTARWAIRWYYACAVFLAFGAVVGATLAHNVVWTSGDLLAAHLALNVGGWIGTAIVGTLHTFFPSLTHGLLRHPRLQGPTFAAWTSGVAALAIGTGLDLGSAIVAGWVALSIAAAMLCVNIVHSAITAAPPKTLATRLVGTAQLFLVAGLLVALTMLAVDGPATSISGGWRQALAVLVGLGWIGMTVSGSMIHLLTVLNRVRNFLRAMPEPRRVRDIAVTVGLASAIGLLALSTLAPFEELAPYAAMSLLVFALPLLLRIASLAVRASSLVPGFTRLRSDR